MIKNGMTVREAAQEWVKTFDAIQRGMIEKLMSCDYDGWHEVTLPNTGDRVYVYELPDDGSFKANSGEILGFDEEKGEYRILLDDEKVVFVAEDEFEVEHDDTLPMWNTMWSFGDMCDTRWLENKEGIRKMSERGFRVYESDEFGYFFGIDGCGYDFYEEHWIPLYRARGLQWHDPENGKSVSN